MARFAAQCTRSWLVVEWLGVEDPQLRLLCAQRKREPAEFGLERQRAAFRQAGFDVESECPLPGTSRVLALLRRGP